ncbi:unnamed protein product [Phytophthora lilii]|uniref:Unnamed protein product n=1 Tax=Phytophthora lilii TaxID=2077276 RepID=A0A9W6T8Y9_9STRA|nr:unnamed protein product [Phytophthora lilii]
MLCPTSTMSTPLWPTTSSFGRYIMYSTSCTALSKTPTPFGTTMNKSLSRRPLRIHRLLLIKLRPQRKSGIAAEDLVSITCLIFSNGDLKTANVVALAK